jgi:hypothetical protein
MAKFNTIGITYLQLTVMGNVKLVISWEGIP